MKKIENLKNVYLRKTNCSCKIYLKINEFTDRYLFKVIDTFTDEEIYEVIPKEIITLYYYTAYDFLKYAKFLGKSCYYPDSIFFYLNKIMLYKDDNYELLYDIKNNKTIIIPSSYSLDELIISNFDNNIEINDVQRIR